MRCIWTALACLTALMASGRETRADDVADFYKGRTLEIVVNSSVGGGYDQYARMIARHMGRHIAGNPTLVVKNMEGAGGLRMANWLAGVAPRDGSVIGAASRAMAFEPLLGNKAAQYDGTKFTWIGSANDEVSVCVAWATSGIRTWNDLLERELVVGASGGPNDDTYQFPALLRNMFGAKLKIVGGYPGGNEINLAMERGEVKGRCGIPWSTVKATRQVWLESKSINLLLQFSLAKHKDLPDVPLVTDLATTDEQRQILKVVFGRQVMGRPYAGPPGVPAARVAALRQAFLDTMADAAFVAEVEKAKFEVTPVSGERIETLVREAYASTSAAFADELAAMLK